MSQSPSSNPAAPVDAGWDIAFTRLGRAVGPHVDRCMQALKRQFEVIGLRCESQLRQTPRGLSMFLPVVGRRGLLCIVEIALIDGMVLAEFRGAALDIRLLDGCGNAVTRASAFTFHAAAPALVAAAGLDRAVTSIYVTALAHFDLLTAGRPRPRQPR